MQGNWKLMRFVTSKESARCGQTSGQNESLRCVQFGDTLIQRSEQPTGSDLSKLASSWGSMQPTGWMIIKIEKNLFNELECNYIAGFVI